MNRKPTHLSGYKITWIEFRATKGIVTKKDYMVLAKYPDKYIGKQGTRFHEHFPSKEMALEYLSNLDTKKLGKSYEVRLMSDKQFGMGKIDFSYPLNDDRRKSFPFTKQQEKEMFIIGK